MALDAFLPVLLLLLFPAIHSPTHFSYCRPSCNVLRLSEGGQPPLTTAMPESSQPRTHSTLSQMTRADQSDDPNSDSMAELAYQKSLQTASIPTKSGTEVAIRSYHQSDDRPSRSGLSSRPSSRGGELDHDDAELIEKCSAAPSTADFAVQKTELMKRPLEPELGQGFSFGKVNIPAAKASGISQSTQSSQSSQAVPPDSFEKSNQEHQVWPRSAQQERSHAPASPASRGLDKIFSWLSFWLTLNIQVPVDLQKDVQPTNSPLFQNIPGVQVLKASLTPHARPKVPQLSQKQPRRKR